MLHAHRIVALLLICASSAGAADYRPLGADENLQALDALCARLAEAPEADTLPGFNAERTRIERINCAAWEQVKRGEPVGAVVALEALTSAGLATPDDDAAVRALDSAGAMLQRIGEPQRAAEVHAQALERSADGSMAAHRIGPLVNLAILLSRLGDMERAQAHADDALALLEATGQRGSEARLRHVRGSLHLARGEHREAEAEFSRGLALARASGDPNVSAFLMMGQANARRAAGDDASARALLREALAGIAGSVDRDASVRLRLALAEVEGALGDTDAGVALAREALALASEGSLGHSLVQAHRALAGLLERAGDTAAALAEYKRYAELNTQFLGQQNIDRIARIEAMRRSELDRRRIEALEQANRLQALELDRAQSRRSILIGVGAAILAGGLLVIWLQQRMNRRLQLISSTDSLTGLHNRYYLRRRMDHETPDDGAIASGRRSVALLLDIDHFKRVNDRYGHDVGDQALREVAERLERLCRAGDEVARWGGEEFLLIAADLDFDGACTLAARLVAAIGEQPLRLDDGRLVPLSVSVGLAPYPFFGDRAQVAWEPTLKLADVALYGVKRAGRNGWAALWGEQADGLGEAIVAIDPQAAVDTGAVRLAASRPPVWQVQDTLPSPVHAS